MQYTYCLQKYEIFTAFYSINTVFNGLESSSNYPYLQTFMLCSKNAGHHIDGVINSLDTPLLRDNDSRRNTKMTEPVTHRNSVSYMLLERQTSRTELGIKT